MAPHLAPGAIFASNTSGLAITELAQTLPAALRKRFCGIHFFNPPRYMRLVELIPTAQTDPAVLDRLETFLTTTLGKGVVRAKDTPNFVANRVGVFSMLATMHHTVAFQLGFDEVDALTGPAIGRAKSATYRTADVVGLDTMAHVVKTMADTLPNDPWAAYYKSPEWLAGLIAKGALGPQTRDGMPTLAPMMELTIKEKITACRPRNAPMAAMNFTSPKPIASRGNTISALTASRQGTDSGSNFSSPICNSRGESRTSTFLYERSTSSTVRASNAMTSDGR